MSRPRVGFVVQRCGADVNGGAESLCYQVAHEMGAFWDVEILTTCARDYMTWANVYPEGPDRVGEVAVRRFSVDAPRNLRSFNALSRRAVESGATLSVAEGERWMKAQGPYSSSLLTYLRERGHEYEAVFFFTYLYATTYFGLPIVAGRAFLVPFAHDEWTLRLPIWDRFFELPEGFVFSTPEERDVLRARFPTARLSGILAGSGMRIPDDIDVARFRDRFDIPGPFALYVGRVDVNKGCEQLLADFERYCDLFPDDGLSLVFVGQAVMPIPDHPRVRALGFVDDGAKFDAIAACDVLVMPSELESLSLALLEAWALGRPTLANASSPVLVGQSRRSNAGLWYRDSAEFVAGLGVLREPETARALGRSGRRFVAEECSWERVVRAYRELLEERLAL